MVHECIACGLNNWAVHRTRWTVILACKNCDCIVIVDKQVWDGEKHRKKVVVQIPLERYNNLERIERALSEINEQVRTKLLEYQHWASVFQDGGQGSVAYKNQFKEGIEWIRAVAYIFAKQEIPSAFDEFDEKVWENMYLHTMTGIWRNRIGKPDPERIESPKREGD